MTAPVVGRFAPSPTGPLHLGSLVAAVGSWLFARSAGGLWLLRMEDLDAARVVTGCADDILWTLEALGLTWDGEVVYQSRRAEAYKQAFEGLLRKGLIYPCCCSRAEIATSSSAPHLETGEIPYPGTCRNGMPAGREARSYRLYVADEWVSFEDDLLGEQSQFLRSVCGDFIVKRADGPFAYHLAVVVDDAYSGVNQVVRGADLILSTPRQVYLYSLLGKPQPAYAHLPLVTGPGGGKLSKRDNAVSLTSTHDLCKEAGRLIHFALSFLGLTPPAELAMYPPSELLSWGLSHFLPTAISTVTKIH